MGAGSLSAPRPPPSVDPMSGRLDPALCSTAALDAEPRKGTCKRPDNESLAGAIEPNCQRRHHGALARTVEPNCQRRHHGALARTVEPNCQWQHHGGSCQDQLNQIASGDIMGLMPGPMQLLGGGQTNSIQNMLTLGNALMKCSDSQQQDLVQCLGFQIVGSVPPLNFLNRLGDIFGEFIAAFAKVASTVAAQAMKGGESLLQTAATTEFPSAGAQAMVHHRGQELCTSRAL